ncbi:MAG: hypothetical protein M5R42_09445 [Rhodocyclaceae bacterium]|nr:hypothetical protein [Rhodocyclaceae bacterium]
MLLQGREQLPERQRAWLLLFAAGGQGHGDEGSNEERVFHFGSFIDKDSILFSNNNQNFELDPERIQAESDSSKTT